MTFKNNWGQSKNNWGQSKNNWGQSKIKSIIGVSNNWGQIIGVRVKLNPASRLFYSDPNYSHPRD